MTNSFGKTWNGQLVTFRGPHGEDYLPCANCGSLVGMRSSAWIDTFDNKQKHFKCLSAKRMDEIRQEKLKSKEK